MKWSISRSAEWLFTAGANHDNVRLSRIDRHAAQVPDVETGARRTPRRTGVVTLEVSVARRDAQRIGRITMNGELVGVPRTTDDAVAPGAAAIDRGHERACLYRNPQSFRFERVARDPANVMSVRSRRKRPFR